MGCETHDTAEPEQDRVKIRMPDAVMLLQCSCDRIDIRPGVGDFAGRFEHIRCDGKNIHCRPEQIIDNLSILNAPPLTDEELKQIESILSK